MLSVACSDDTPASAPTSPTPTVVEVGAPRPEPSPVARPPTREATATATTAGRVTLSIEVQVGQLIFAGIPGTQLGSEARRLIDELHVGNVILMGENVSSASQVAGLTAELQERMLQSNGIGAFIGTDQEGGLVQRLVRGFTRLPDAASVGATGDAALAQQYGAVVGAELQAVGVNMPLGPVLDVNDNPANPVIGRRAFGTTVVDVVRVALPFIDGLRSGGVIAVGKHFPGHGNTELDSHFAMPVVKKSRAELERTELAPFAAAIRGGLGAVMVAHVAYPALDASGLPASVSPAIVSGLLKEQMGFSGVVITDDLGMVGVTGLLAPEDAAVAAVKAGVDLVICVSRPCDVARTHAALMRAVRSGEISGSRLADAYRRVTELKRAYDVGRAFGGDLSLVGSAAHRAVVDEVLRAAGGE